MALKATWTAFLAALSAASARAINIQSDFQQNASRTAVQVPTAERALLSSRQPLVPGMDVSMSLSTLGGTCYTQNCPAGAGQCSKAGQRYYNTQEMVSQLATSMGMACNSFEQCHDYLSPAIKPDGTCCVSGTTSACGHAEDGWYRFCGCDLRTTYPDCDGSPNFPCKCGQELCEDGGACDCYEVPTSAPTPSPTTAMPSATGDPHLQNIHGERFDLMNPGKYVLINIPRGKAADSAMLRVQADAVRLGKNCGDLYFQELNVTGSWAEAKQEGGYRYSVSQSEATSSGWAEFGKVALKIVIARTDRGIQYLNVYAKHLGQSGFAVGGLLGEDDHEEASTPPEACAKRVSLAKGAGTALQTPPIGSVAEATLA